MEGWESCDCWEELESAIDILRMNALDPENDEEEMKIARKLENRLNIGRKLGSSWRLPKKLERFERNLGKCLGSKIWKE